MSTDLDPTERVFEATVDWIGDWPISHGERDVGFDAPDAYACLCGIRLYTACPDRAGDGSVLGLTIYPADGGVS